MLAQWWPLPPPSDSGICISWRNHPDDQCVYINNVFLKISGLDQAFKSGSQYPVSVIRPTPSSQPLLNCVESLHLNFDHSPARNHSNPSRLYKSASSPLRTSLVGFLSLYFKVTSLHAHPRSKCCLSFATRSPPSTACACLKSASWISPRNSFRTSQMPRLKSYRLLPLRTRYAPRRNRSDGPTHSLSSFRPRMALGEFQTQQAMLSRLAAAQRPPLLPPSPKRPPTP